MALCELKTAAHYSIPMECTSLVSGHDGSVDTIERSSYSSCVEAMSRSTQSWASYSGYLREIPQLCFAFRNANGIDQALQLYKNATVEKIAFLRHLGQRTSEDEAFRDSWRALADQSHKTAVSLQHLFTFADGFLARIEDTLGNKLHEMIALARAFDSQLQHRAVESFDHALSQHSQYLSDMAISFGNDMSSRINSNIEVGDRHFQTLFSLTELLQGRWLEMDQNLGHAAQVVHNLLVTASATSAQLNDSLLTTKALKREQMKTSRFTVHLAESIQKLSSMAKDEMVKINETALAVSRGLPSGFFFPNGFINAWPNITSSEPWLWTVLLHLVFNLGLAFLRSVVLFPTPVELSYRFLSWVLIWL